MVHQQQQSIRIRGLGLNYNDRCFNHLGRVDAEFSMGIEVINKKGSPTPRLGVGLNHFKIRIIGNTVFIKPKYCKI